jgi:uncharacterized membrane protein YkvA (DUF1232 family)
MSKTMRIVIELGERDQRYFEEAMAKARLAVRSADEVEILESAKHTLDATPLGDAPDYIKQRISKVQRLVQMLEDEAWALPTRHRAEVIAALVYFSDPEDLIPDELPVIGMLDDAIMLELVLRREHGLLDAYDRFCRARTALGPRPEGPGQRTSWGSALTAARADLLSELDRAAKE